MNSFSRQQHSNRCRYIDCHISEFPTFRGSLSSENSSRPATSAQFSPTIHCDINSESEEPDALHMAPTSSPKITYSSRPSWKGCPNCPFHKSKVQRSAHHSRPSLSNASSSNRGPRYQNGSMEKHGPVGQRMNHLVSGGIPCCARNSQLLPFNMLLPLLAPWPHSLLLHPFSIIDPTKIYPTHQTNKSSQIRMAFNFTLVFSSTITSPSVSFFFFNPTCASKVNSESRRCKFSGRKKWQQGESRTDKLQPRGGNRFVSGTLRR